MNLQKLILLILCLQTILPQVPPPNDLTSSRPQPNKRRFNSTIVNEMITNITSNITSDKLKVMFTNCYPNTVDTTVYYTDNFNNTGKPDTFIITGDIYAMWGRDSMNQVLPYIQHAAQDAALASMIKGLIRRQAANILIDPYANAFNQQANGNCFKDDDTTKIVNGSSVQAMNPWIYERKYESDSLSSLLKLSYLYYKATNDTSFIDAEWIKSLQTILDVFTQELKGTDEELSQGDPAYTFFRTTDEPLDSLIHGIGKPSLKNGMIKQGFRPSDDGCALNLNIPGNAMASVVLNQTSIMLSAIGQQALAQQCANLSQSVKQAIYAYGVGTDSQGKQYFHYEVDGYGNSYFMDDANVPSLLALPYLGFVDINDTIYQNTRAKLLNNKTNPYYYSGQYAAGIGSPHNAGYNYIWPMAIAIQALTTEDTQEIIQCIKYILYNTDGTYFMHESFNVNNPSSYMRPWFSWANTLFGFYFFKGPSILQYNFDNSTEWKQ